MARYPRYSRWSINALRPARITYTRVVIQRPRHLRTKHDQPLVLEPPSRIRVPRPVLQLPHRLDLLRNRLPPSILPLQHPPQHRANPDVRNQVPQRERMPHDVPRPVIRPVQLRAQHGAAVADRDLHGVAHGTLRLSGDVDGGPGQHERGGRVDAPRGEEGAHIRDTGPAGRVRVREEDGVANGSEEGGAADEEGSLAEALAEDGDSEGGGEAERVGRDGQELSDGGFVAEVADDGRLSWSAWGGSYYSYGLTRKRENV